VVYVHAFWLQNPCNRRYREPVFTQVANATHAAWRYAEELRSYLNDLVSEFSLADSIRRQVAVYKRYVYSLYMSEQLRSLQYTGPCPLWTR
jgi:hypothetical protein